MIEVLLIILNQIASFQFNEFQSYVSGGDNPTPIPPSLQTPDIPCTQDNKTYTVDLKVHLQDSVIQAIFDVARSSAAANETEREAVSGYLGTIIDELNDYLLDYKVQIHLKLDAYNVDQFMAQISVDPSCEKTSPVIDRTSAAFDFLQDSFAGNIGLHLFIWGCIYVPPNSELKAIYNSLKCGRVGGVLWTGMDETRDLIKNTIIDALVGLEQLHKPSPAQEANISAELCKYVQNCIGMKPTELGQLIGGTTPVRYTDSEELASPAEAEAVIEYNVMAH